MVRSPRRANEYVIGEFYARHEAAQRPLCLTQVLASLRDSDLNSISVRFTLHVYSPLL